MPPLSQPSGGDLTGLQISTLQAQALTANTGPGSASTGWGTVTQLVPTAEFILCAGLNRIGFMTELGQGQVINYAGQPDAGSGFAVNPASHGFRSRVNHGAGVTGSIFVQIAANELGRSDDDGATWALITNPTLNTLRGLVAMSNGRVWLQTEDNADDGFFSDDGGATWTSQTLNTGAGSARRAPVASRDGARVIFTGNSSERFSFTTTLNGAPVITSISLTAETGQASGPGGSQSGSAFDSFGGCLLVGDFGDVCYTPDFLQFQLIPDDENPAIRGDNVTSTSQAAAAWSEAHQGFIYVANGGNSPLGAACFFPLSDGVIGTAKQIAYTDVHSGTAGPGVADADGNILFTVIGDNDLSIVSLIDKAA